MWSAECELTGDLKSELNNLIEWWVFSGKCAAVSPWRLD